MEVIINLEVEVAINLIKRGKAVGYDGNTSELLKNLVINLIKLTILLNKIYTDRLIE